MPRGSLIRLLIHTPELDSQRIEELASWLRSDIPTNLSLEVEDIVRKTASLQTLITDVKTGSEAVGQALKTEEVEEIALAWNKISHLLARYQGRREELLGEQPFIKLLEAEARGFLKQLDSCNEELIDSVEQGLLRSVRGEDEFTKTIDVPEIETLGISSTLRMRQMILYPDQHPAVSETPSLDAPTPRKQLENGWTETKHYGKYLDPALLPEVEQRISFLAGLLGASKSSSFHSLVCSRWWHDAENKQFVLEFDPPRDCELSSVSPSWTSLKDIILTAKGSSRPTLGQRFHIAFSVAQAVHQWHAVGWVHQSINSHNIIFFHHGRGRPSDTAAVRDPDSVEPDLGRPFLQGFDFARPNVGRSIGRYVDDPATNVYRHPDRQGPSGEGHTKLHDLYALGVVLLEIGLWEDACVTARVHKIGDAGAGLAGNPGKGRGKDVLVKQMYERLEEAARTRLAHYMGRDYQELVTTCLTSGLGVTVDDQFGSQLTKAFHRLMVDKLGKSIVLR